MKILRNKYKVVFTILLAMIVLFNNTDIARADGKNSGKRMNVVFVLDQSGSMANTDTAALRYEAVELFLGLASDTGNYMGAVVFDDSIVMRQDIAEINGKASKDALAEKIRGAKSNGDTDIGKALDTAAQMLVSSGNKDIPSAIILLSDGNTDLPKDTTGEALKASEQSKQNAIQTARENGINIYTICLNANGEARVDELQDISDATGGTCVEVRNAEDLKEVFSQFYNMIYFVDTINLADTIIPDSGELEVSFDIPVMGVEEANIIISTLNTDTAYNLVNPDGYGYIRAEMEEMEIKAKSFTIIKIPNPKPGSWMLRVKGVPGDQIKIDMIYNLLLSINLEMEAEALDETNSRPETITFRAQLVNDGNLVTDMQVYERYPLMLAVENADSGNIQEIRMETGSAESIYSLQNIEAGSYDVRAYCDVDGAVVKSNIVTLTIDQSIVPPETETETESETQSGSEEPLPKPQRDWGEIIKIVLFVVLVIVLIVGILLILLYLRSVGIIGKRIIRGRIQCYGYNEGYLGAPTTLEGTKGRMRLGRYLRYNQDVGVDFANSYLIAGEKSGYIYLISKKGYYTDKNLNTKSKKIRLDANIDIQISSDMDLRRYLKIIYLP